MTCIYGCARTETNMSKDEESYIEEIDDKEEKTEPAMVLNKIEVDDIDDFMEIETSDSDENDSEIEEDTGSENDEEAEEAVETAKPDFYYEPLSDEIKQRITGLSYPMGECQVKYEDLSYVHILYVDFNDEIKEGELICANNLAQDFVEIFTELYNAGYQLQEVSLVDKYGADDDASCEANNTSAFNYRVVAGSTKLSKHSYGRAIDVNPMINPYVTFKTGTPATKLACSQPYIDRSVDFPHKIDENDLCYTLFKAHGFTWGGDWNSVKDYQHFEK